MQTDTPFHSVIGIGAFKVEYRAPKRSRTINLVTGIVFLALGPLLLLLSAWLAYDAYNQRGLRGVDDAIALPLIAAALAFGLGVLILFNAWRNWTLAAALYESGVALNGRGGMRQAAWHDVAAVWQAVTRHYTNGVYTGTTHVYTLQTTAGEKLVFDDRLGKQVEQLGQEIQRGVTNALYPRYWQSLQNGQRLTFGPLALDRDKLYAGKKELRWDEIKAIKIEKGQIAVRKDKAWLNWASASVPQIPNFFIFYDLIGRFAKVE
jgi:hypothetical protein